MTGIDIILALKQLEKEGHQEAYNYVHENGKAVFVDGREMLPDKILQEALSRVKPTKTKREKCEEHLKRLNDVRSLDVNKLKDCLRFVLEELAQV